MMKTNNLLSLTYAFILLPFFVQAMEPAVLTMHAGKPANTTTLVKSEESQQSMGERFDNSLYGLCGPCFYGCTYVSKKMSKCYFDTEMPLSDTCRSCALTCCLLATPFEDYAKPLFDSNCPLVTSVVLCKIIMPRVQGAMCDAMYAGCISYLAHRLERLERRKAQGPNRAITMGASTINRD